MRTLSLKKNLVLYPSRLINVKKLPSKKDFSENGMILGKKWRIENVSILKKGLNAAGEFVLQRDPQKIETFEKTISIIPVSRIVFLIDVQNNWIWVTSDRAIERRKERKQVIETLARHFNADGTIPVEISLPKLSERLKTLRNIRVHSTSFHTDEIWAKIRPDTHLDIQSLEHTVQYDVHTQDMTMIDFSWSDPDFGRIMISVRKDRLILRGLRKRDSEYVIYFLGNIAEVFLDGEQMTASENISPNLRD